MTADMAKKNEKPEYDEDEDDDDDDDEARKDAVSKVKAAGMLLWTRRLAFFLGFCGFVVMFLVSFDFDDYFNYSVIIIATVKGLGTAMLFWMAGLIIGNIFLKGLITDIPVDQDHLLEGGMLQRIYLYQQLLNYDQDGNVIQVDPRTDTIVRRNVKNDK